MTVLLWNPAAAYLPGRAVRVRSQGRPFSAFPTIHRMVGIACGDRLQTHFVAPCDGMRG